MDCTVFFCSPCFCSQRHGQWLVHGVLQSLPLFSSSLPPLLFFFHRGSRWRSVLVLFLFIKDLLDILSPGSVWGKCDLAQRMEQELPHHNGYTLQRVIYYKMSGCQWTCSEEMWCGGVVQSLDLIRFPIVPPRFSSFKLAHSALFCCFFFYTNLLTISLSLSRSLVLSHPGGPSFYHCRPTRPSSLLGPSCMQSRCQAGQGGQQLPRKGGGRVLGAKHTHAHTLSVSLSLSLSVLFCVLLPSPHTSHTHMCSLSSAGRAKTGSGDRESWKCLSVRH